MSNSIYSLYLKIHNDTGLKYLGKTIKNPYKYGGSGIYWKKHLKKHGNNVRTEILGTYENESALLEAALYYSKLWNVEKSDEFANLVIETGKDGGAHTDESKEKIRQAKIKWWERNPNAKKQNSIRIKTYIKENGHPSMGKNRSPNLTGQQFSRLTVIKKAGVDKDGGSLWLCECNCGNQTVVPRHSLVRGRTKSCGCYMRERSRQEWNKRHDPKTGKLQTL